MTDSSKPIGKSLISPPTGTFLAVAVAMNLPFLLCYPEWPVLKTPLVRSLIINFVLFVAPGLPIVNLMIHKGWLRQFYVLWVIFLSFLTFVSIIVARYLFDLPVSAGGIWLWTWVITNLGFLLNLLAGGPPTFGISVNCKRTLSFLLLFVAAYVIFFYGATRVVPVLGDQDDEVQGTAYGLLTRLKPSLLTGRNTEYMFAHPPLLHVYVAGSILYYNLLDEVAVYDSQSPNRLSLSEIDERYRQHPYVLETRTPNVFLAALTVVLLGWWVTRMTGRRWFGALVASAYATTPEVFVRSVYGGYFTIGNFALVQILLAVEAWMSDHGRFTRMTCVLAGIFAALADHKMMLLPVSVVIWEALGSWRKMRFRAAAKALMHPVAIGFAVGTLMFWAYGLAISPKDFWMDHIRHHLVDRVLNYNARGLDMSHYPSVPALWLEFWRDMGYLLLPLGIVSLGFLCFAKASTINAENANSEAGWRGMPGLWAIWASLISFAFSIIDWRQTKHLAPLSLALFLAPACMATRRVPRIIIGGLLVALLIWNIGVLSVVAGNFDFLKKVPEW